MDLVESQKEMRSIIFIWIIFFLVEVIVASGMLIISPILYLFLFLFVVVAAVFLLRPEFPFYLLMLSLPVWCFFIKIGHQNYRFIKFLDLFTIATLLSWTFFRLAKQRPGYPGSACDLPIMLFGAWTFLSLSWSNDLSQGIFEVSKLFIGFIGFVLTISIIRSHRILKTVFTIIILMGVISAVVSVSSSHFDIGYKYSMIKGKNISLENGFWFKTIDVRPGGRGQGFAPPHATGVLLIMPIMFGLGLVISEFEAKKKKGLIFLIILMLAGLVNTMTKGAILAMLAGMIFIILHIKPLKNRFFTSVIIIIATICILFILVRITNIGRAVDFGVHQFVHATEKSTSIGSRLAWWKTGMQGLLSSYGRGLGAGGFRVQIDNPVPNGTHAAVLFDLGFVGFFIWIWILLGAFHSFWLSLKKCGNEYYRRLLIVYIGGYIAVLLSWTVSFYYEYIDLWIYLGIGFALVQLSEKASMDSQKKIPLYKKNESVVTV